MTNIGERYIPSRSMDEGEQQPGTGGALVREGAPSIRPLPERPTQPERAPHHNSPYYEDTDKPVSIDGFKASYQEEFALAKVIATQAKDLVQRQENESDFDYEYRVFNEVESRLRYPGDYRTGQDQLYATILNTPALPRPDLVLMGVEAARIDLLRTANEETQRHYENEIRRVMRRDVKTEVTHIGEPSFIEGDYEYYFGPKAGPDVTVEARQMPKADVRAWTLVADRLLDATDPTTRKQDVQKTYREQMQRLHDILRDPATLESEKQAVSRQLLDLRKEFYNRAVDVVRNVDNPADFNPHADSTSEQATNNQMREILQRVRESSIEDLIAQYQGVTTGLSEDHKQEMRVMLGSLKPQLLDMALKGGDLMRRRISYSPKLHDVPELRFKKFVQGPQDERGATPQESSVRPEPAKPVPPEVSDEDKGEEGAGQGEGESEEPVTLPPAPPEPEPPSEPPQPEPEPPTLQTELEIGVVAAKQRIEHKIGQKQRQEMEVLEERAREIARLKMDEDREKWQGRFAFVRQFIPRLWKYHMGEIRTYGKEKAQAIQLLAQSGIQTTTLPYEFLQRVDQLARQNINSQRAGMRRFTGAIRDLAHEATFTQRALHRQQIDIMRDLRQAVENPTATLPTYLQNNPQLVQEFSRILTGDFQASEALAKKINSQFGDEVIHGVVGERRAQQAVELTGPVKELFSKTIHDLLRNGLIRSDGTLDEQLLMQKRREIQEFFFKPEFVQWYDQQPQEVKDSLKLSLSYGSDIIPLIQEVLLPQALQAKAHLDAGSNLAQYVDGMVLKVRTGTLESGQKGVIEEGRLEGSFSRTITNQRVLNLYQQIRTQGTVRQLVPHTYLDAASNRADLLGGLGRVGTHQVAIGAAVGFGLYAGRVGAGTAARVAIPIVGGSVVTGALRAAQEYRAFTREREEHEVEREVGYGFAQDAARREHMRRVEFHKRKMQTELTDPLRQLTTELRAGQPVAQDRLMRCTGLLADTMARFRMMDSRGVGLLAASGPQSYQLEKTNLEIARAEAMVVLRAYLTGHQNELQQIQNQLGMQGDSIDAITNKLIDNQINHLEKGLAIDARYQAALGSVSIAQAESIDARERAFTTARRNRAVLHGAATAGTTAGVLFAPEVVGGAVRFVATLTPEPVRRAVGEVVAPVGRFAGRVAGEVSSRAPEPIRRAAEWVGLGRPRSELFGVNLQDAYDNPRNFGIGPNQMLAVSPDVIDGGRAVTVVTVDANGNTVDTLPGPPMWLQRNSNGSTSAIIAGTPNHLPPQVRSALAGWEARPTTVHSLFHHMEDVARGGVSNAPDEVLGEQAYKGSFLVNTHDVAQSPRLIPGGEPYDQWAAREGRIDRVTGQIEVGKMSVTGPDSTMLHGFLRSGGNFDVDMNHYGNEGLPQNPQKLAAMIARMRLEGWEVLQDTADPSMYHITAPIATEYVPQESRGTIQIRIPFIWWPRRPLEAPEKEGERQRQVESQQPSEREQPERESPQLPAPPAQSSTEPAPVLGRPDQGGAAAAAALPPLPPLETDEVGRSEEFQMALNLSDPKVIERILQRESEVIIGSEAGQSLFEMLPRIQDLRRRLAEWYSMDPDDVEAKFLVMGTVTVDNHGKRKVTIERFVLPEFEEKDFLPSGTIPSVTYGERGLSKVNKIVADSDLDLIYDAHSHPNSFRADRSAEGLSQHESTFSRPDVETIVNDYRISAESDMSELQSLMVRNFMVLNPDPIGDVVSFSITDNRADGLYTRQGYFDVRTGGMQLDDRWTKVDSVQPLNLERLKQAAQVEPARAAAPRPGVEIDEKRRQRLNIEVDRFASAFERMHENGMVEECESFPTGGRFVWQGVRYGPEHVKDSDNSYRGYLMVEAEDIPGALNAVARIARERKAQGKTTEFKWLVMTHPPFQDPGEWAPFVKDVQNFGAYTGLDARDPRIVIYGDSVDEVKEILTDLSQQAEWHGIEGRRNQAFGGRPAPRRPGTNAFIEQARGGREWRSLNYNEKPGYSEAEASDPEWRSRKEGSPSVVLPQGATDVQAF